MHNLDKDEWYDEIQQAIDVAEDNNTLLVYPGTYEEFVTIDKPLILLGPNAGIPGCNNNRGDEAVIKPPADADRVEPNVTRFLVAVSAEGVVIDGFMMTDEEDENGKFGATVGINSKEGDFQCLNNYVKSMPFYGINVARPAKATTDWYDKTVADDGAIEEVLIQGNCIEETALVDAVPTWGYGISLSGTIADVVENKIKDSRVGIHIQPYNQPDVEITKDGLVKDNVVETYRIGVFHHTGGVSGHYAVSANWLFEGNTFTLCEGPLNVTTGSYWGVITWTSKFYHDKSIEFVNNTFDTTNKDDFTFNWDEIIVFLYRNDIGTHTANDINFIYIDNTFTGMVTIMNRSGLEIDLTEVGDPNNNFPDGDTEIVTIDDTDDVLRYVE